MPPSSKIEEMRVELLAKMAKLIEEFSAGKISSEQFNIIYARYHNQMSLVEQSEDGTPQEAPVSTIAVLESTRGRAIGLAIYHHRSGIFIETLGNFNVPLSIMSPVLNDFSDKLDTREFVEPMTKKLAGDTWVVFLARELTTAIVQFKNEPARLQMRQMERMHHAFEEANRHLLQEQTVDQSKLARPFLGFVKEKLSS